MQISGRQAVQEEEPTCAKLTGVAGVREEYQNIRKIPRGELDYKGSHKPWTYLGFYCLYNRELNKTSYLSCEKPFQGKNTQEGVLFFYFTEKATAPGTEV